VTQAVLGLNPALACAARGIFVYADGMAHMAARVSGEQKVVREIKRAFARERSGSLRVGIGDDAALWRVDRGQEAMLTCDWFLEGTHFLRDKHPPDAVGWKSLARAASDVAAMGGTPKCFLLSLALPASCTDKWLRLFLRGLRRASRTLSCQLAGGDTTRRDEILINTTVVGEVAAGRAVLRSGARAGDLLYVSGTLGEAELGLRELGRQRGAGNASSNSFLRKHLYPEPRIALGQWLAKNHLATAMMDLSDGLSSDLPRLCSESGVGARIAVASLPCAPRSDAKDALELALNGGDDYELLFAVRPENARKIGTKFHGLALTRIGEITRDKRVVAEQDGKSRPLTSGGWDPFR
jgi:thiamine-monophosphate kinase